MTHTNYFTRILLVDDDREDCSLFQEALSEAAPEAALSCVEGGKNLLGEVEACRPSLIVIDYKLTRENGIECVQQLKAHPEFRAIPVVMWSTSALFSQIKAAYGAGVHHYFEKPWNINELVEKLKVLVALSRWTALGAGTC